MQTDYRLELPELPQRVILGTSELLIHFKYSTAALQVTQEPYVEHVVAEVFELLHEREYVHEAIAEYVQDHYTHLDGSSVEQVRLYCEELRRLCWGLYECLEAAKLYSSHGVLWFDFEGLLGADTVLRLGDLEICT